MKSTGFDCVFDLGVRNSKISHALLESKHGEFTSFGKDFIVLLVWFLRISARWKLGDFHCRDLLRRNDAIHMSAKVVENQCQETKVTTSNASMSTTFNLGSVTNVEYRCKLCISHPSQISEILFPVLIGTAVLPWFRLNAAQLDAADLP